MKALRFDGASLSLDRAAAAPVPGPGEAVIRPTRLGVSASDVEIAAGRIPFKGVLGNEFVGVVEDVNIPSDALPPIRSREGLKGQRVVGSPSIVCGVCDMCRAGLSPHCRSRKVLGVSERDGCMAERFTIPLLNLHAVPQHIDDEAAVLATLVARALHAANLVHVESRLYVTILGDTALALLTAQALARLNKSVRLLGSRPERVALCERWGVKHRLIEEAGRRQDQEVVIDCTGAAANLRLAMQLVRPRGVILLCSDSLTPPFPPGVPLPEEARPGWTAAPDLAPAITNELTILGAREGPLADALSLLERAELETAHLITHRAKLADAPAAIATAARDDQIKVLIET